MTSLTNLHKLGDLKPYKFSFSPFRRPASKVKVLSVLNSLQRLWAKIWPLLFEVVTALGIPWFVAASL
jgi:hypothetical protein